MVSRSSLGDPRKRYPIPLRLRNCNVLKQDGGSLGYRGAAFAKARLQALRIGKNRSTNTGRTANQQVTLEVDHIHPYRQGGLTGQTNRQSNLRITDSYNNKFSDAAQTFKERPRRRKLEKF